MAMSYIWSGLVILSFLWGFFHEERTQLIQTVER